VKAVKTAAGPSRRISAGIEQVRRLAIVPAFNEEGSIGGVIDEIRAFDPGFEILVIDDGSSDRTAKIAAARRVHVVTLPFNLGIGAAMQTGFRFAQENGFDVAVQVDGDGQHDPTELSAILQPIIDEEADLVIGSRFSGAEGFRSSFLRRLGIRVFSLAVSVIAHQRLTDTTSGFRAVNRRGIALFATNYPHDYPEVEATVMLIRHRLRVKEVPTPMRPRLTGHSSITPLRSVYYMVKVLLALLVDISRRSDTPMRDA